MNTVAKAVAGVAAAGIIAGGSYAAGGRFQDPRVHVRTVTQTRTKTVQVPGPIRWKTKRVSYIPQDCQTAIDLGGQASSQLDGVVDDFDALENDTYNTISDAYNAGARGDSSIVISNTLTQLQRRGDDLHYRTSTALNTLDAYQNAADGC